MSRIITLPLMVALVFTNLLAQAPVTYEYDAAGRLVGVVDSSGNAAAYKYDAAGNITSISRYTSSQVAVITFSPISGPVGGTVTISGSGFSTTLSQNTVKFNGVVATITTATANQVVAAVPSGATTGTIAVTSPLGTATSSAAFTVTSGSGAPTVTGFSPNWASQGSAITINGTNFSTSSANNVQLNLAFAQVSSATATTISGTVPQNATSGRITVTTPSGRAVSSGDFFVPPVTGVGVSYMGRLDFGQGANVSSVGGGTALIVFDATAGQRISVELTNGSGWACGFFTFGVEVYLMDPVGNTLTNFCAGPGGFIDARVLPMAGTYTIFLWPQNATSGSISVNLYNVVDVTGTAVINGSPTQITTTIPGQNSYISFMGTQGQSVTESLSNLSSGLSCYVAMTLFKPDGSTLAQNFGGICGQFTLGPNTLPVTGTYKILVDPNGDGTGSMTLAVTSN